MRACFLTSGLGCARTTSLLVVATGAAVDLVTLVVVVVVVFSTIDPFRVELNFELVLLTTR